MKTSIKEGATLSEAMEILKKDYMVGITRVTKWQERHICIALLAMRQHGLISREQEDILTAKVYRKLEGRYTLYGYLANRGELSEGVKNMPSGLALSCPEYVTLRDKFIDDIINEIGPDRYL